MTNEKPERRGGSADAPRRTLLHAGGALNARVYKVAGADGSEWIEKDFSSCPWLARNTVGRFLTWREALILRHLGRKTDVVPSGARRVSAFCFKEAFVPGETLRGMADRKSAEGVDPFSGKVFPPEFFDTLEKEVRTIHRAGFVHLDLHNARNVMVGPGFKPSIVDWQSAVPTFFMLPPLRRALERIDIAGVYKFREMYRPGELGPEQARFLERSRFVRRHFWLPRIHRDR